jgi:CheY-like chemotaxis protein
MSNLSLDSQEPASNQSTDVSSPASSNSTVRPRLGPRTSSLPATEQSRLHCLIIDDNPINLQILRITLERLGLSCVVAENGLEGFRRFAETRQNSASGSLPPRPFDLIFMDVYMPLMNGIESTRKIRLLEAEWRKMRKRMEGARKRATSDLEPASQPASRLRAKPLPEDRCMVVAISGGGQEEEAEMKEAGADFFFQRPFTGKDLKRFLASFEKELSQMRSATRTAGGEVGSSTLKQSVE